MSKYTKLFKADEPTIEVCPWQYTSCKLPAGKVCQVRGKVNGAPDITGWKKKALESHFCHHKGEVLAPDQYNHRRMGVWA